MAGTFLDWSLTSPWRISWVSEDFHFLVRQPGFDRSLHRRLKRGRLRISVNTLTGSFPISTGSTHTHFLLARPKRTIPIF